jgi:hypothetical protein
MHVTVGIMIQDIPAANVIRTLNNAEEETSLLTQVDPNNQRRKRRRAYEAHQWELTPYNKCLKLVTEPMLDVEDERRAHQSPYFFKARQLDFLFILEKYLDDNNLLPMWIGWNANIVENKNPMQSIGYLPEISESPTNKSVVLKTLEMSLRLAEECDQRYFLVTYDLAIFKIALAIQEIERNRFEKLFIMLGIYKIISIAFIVCIY